MKVLDAGHQYRLDSIDGDFEQILTFVKREGAKYPGNVEHYPGTTIQEVLRALIDRCKYVNHQTPCIETESVIGLLETAIVLLELRASSRHGRKLEAGIFELVHSIGKCSKCGHIGCKGDCH